MWPVIQAVVAILLLGWTGVAVGVAIFSKSARRYSRRIEKQREAEFWHRNGR